MDQHKIDVVRAQLAIADGGIKHLAKNPDLPRGVIDVLRNLQTAVDALADLVIEPEPTVTGGGIEMSF